MFPAKYLTQLAAIALLLSLSAGKAIASPPGPNERKARLFSEIGFEYAALGSDRALEVFNQAQQSIDAMTNRCYQANPVVRIAGGYWLLERPEADTVPGAQSDRLLNEAIEIAKAQEKTGCSSSATSPTESLANRAREFAKAGHLDLAIALSTKLGDPTSLVEFSTLLAKEGETERADEVLNQAIEFVQEVNAPGRNELAEQSALAGWRTMFLTLMGEELILAERPEAARQVLDRAVESLSALEATANEADAPSQFHAALRIATALTDSGANQQAIELVEQSIPKIQALKAKDDLLEYGVKPLLLIEAAIAHHKLNQQDRAVALLAEVQADRRPDVLGNASIARGYAKIGEFGQALQIARSMPSTSDEQGAFEQIALAYVEAGNEAEAVKIAQSIDNPSDVYSSIVQFYLFDKQPDRAFNFAQTQQVTNLHSELVKGFLEAGAPDRALQIVQAHNLEGFAPDLAQIYAAEGQPDRVIALIDEQWSSSKLVQVQAFANQGQFDRAVQIAESIGSSELKARAFIAIAQAYRDDPPQNGLQSWLAGLADRVESMFGTSDRERAFEMLDRAFQVTQSPLYWGRCGTVTESEMRDLEFEQAITAEDVPR